MDAVSEEDIAEVFAALKRKAKEGDVAAIKLLLAYTVGKPSDAVNPDALDRDEIATMLQNHASTPEMMTQILEGMPADMLLVALRAALPALQSHKLEVAQEALRQPVEDEEADEPEDVMPANGDERPLWMRELAERAEDPTGCADDVQGDPEQESVFAETWDRGEPPIGNGQNGMDRETRNVSCRCNVSDANGRNGKIPGESRGDRAG